MALTRANNPMPPDLADRLRERGLEAAYSERPAYQRNDYPGWIGRAKRDQTRQKRISQMLDELKRGDVYMKIAWRNKT